VNRDAVTTVASIIEEAPWGDIEGSIQAIDFFISRLESVLASEFSALSDYASWPEWLDGRVTDEISVDAAGLNHSETLLLVAALVHDIKLSWRTCGSGLTNSGDVLDALLAVVDRTVTDESED
jgi:hypothetical protein